MDQRSASLWYSTELGENLSTPKPGFNYRRYLATREWMQRKRAVEKRSGGECERCLMAEAVLVHHETYERIGNEWLEDLLHICEGCHDYLNGKSDFDPASLEHHIAHAERMGRGSIHEPYQDFLRMLNSNPAAPEGGG